MKRLRVATVMALLCALPACALRAHSTLVTGTPAQSEVVVSRLLWAAGYFQPATYYLPSWTLVGTTNPNPQPPARG